MDVRTRRLLEGPILPLLVRMAWPNILVMFAQSSTGLIELWFIARLGSDALTAMALVLPGLVLMQNMSQGAMGGGISAAIARALGGGRRDKADAFVFHAIIINAGLGLLFTAAVLAFGPALYRALGGAGTTLDAALTYSNTIFAGMVLLWVFNALGSSIRGTGNMLVPGAVVCGGAVFLIPISPCLIFGFGPMPALGIAGGGAALLIYYAVGILILGWYVASGRSVLRFRIAKPRWPLFREILAVGAVGCVNTIQLNLSIAITTAMVAAFAGDAAVAGFGTGSRLEFLLPPLSFGIGAPLVALVGTNIGAGQPARALRCAMVGGALAFCLTEAVGLAAAAWPEAWLGLFDAGPQVLADGSLYLRVAGPAFGFFGCGLTLYFASQGAGRLGWPLLAGLLRLTVTVAGGWIALYLTGSLTWLFAVYTAALATYGLVITAAVGSGRWFR